MDINQMYLGETTDHDYYDHKKEIKKGAWSSEEDSILINHISLHGEGHWNRLARNSGLKRTGKSCRMRWKNYLHPNVRRGNLTVDEQLRIIQLHTLFGNRWSKIAELLPGRTDNEVKNYWRTRVQKQAKRLNYDINSKEFRDFTRDIWLPSLCEQINASKLSNNLEDVDSTMAMDEPPIQMADNYWFASSSPAADVFQTRSGMDFRLQECDGNLIINGGCDDPAINHHLVHYY